MSGHIKLPRSALTADLWRNMDYGRLLWFLLSRADNNGQLAIGTDTIAKELGLGRQTIRTSLRQLSHTGLVCINSTSSATIITITGCDENSSSDIHRLEPKVFINPEYRAISNWVSDFGRKSVNQGFVYAIEFGQYVKIGCSTIPHNRFVKIKGEYRRSMGLTPGRMAITPLCSNYKTLECEAHTRLRPIEYREENCL